MAIAYQPSREMNNVAAKYAKGLLCSHQTGTRGHGQQNLSLPRTDGNEEQSFFDVHLVELGDQDRAALFKLIAHGLPPRRSSSVSVCNERIVTGTNLNLRFRPKLGFPTETYDVGDSCNGLGRA